MKLLFPTWCGGLGTHRKGETELSGAIDGLEGREDIQKELDRLEQWVHVSPMRFSQAKGKVMDLGHGNPYCHQRLGRSAGTPETCEDKHFQHLSPSMGPFTHQWPPTLSSLFHLQPLHILDPLIL